MVEIPADEMVYSCFQGSISKVNIGICEDDYVTACLLQSGVQGMYFPQPLFGKFTEVDHFDSFVTACQGIHNLTGRICRAIIYKDEYMVTSKSMDFDFKNSEVTSRDQVNLKGKRITLQGLGMLADTLEQVVQIKKDVRGAVQTDTRRSWVEKFR
jgi:hypothetical protein